MNNKVRVLIFTAVAAVVITAAGQIYAAPYSGWENEETNDVNTVGLWHWNTSDGNAVNAVTGGLPLYKNGAMSYAIGGGKFGNGALCPGGTTGTDNWRIASSGGGLSGYDMDAIGTDPSLSVAVWIKPNVLPSASQARHQIIDKAYLDSPSAGYTLYLWYSSGSIYLKGAVGTTAGTAVTISKVISLTSGKWTHIAMTWNAADDTLRVYQDGQVLGSTTSAGKIYAPSTSGSSNPRLLQAGQRIGASYGTFSGVLDDLKVSNTVVEYVRSIPVVVDGEYYGWINEEVVDNRTVGLWHWSESSGNSASNAVLPDGLPLYRYGLMGFTAGKFGNGAFCPGGTASTDYWQIAQNIGGVWGYDMDAIAPDSNLSVAVWIDPNVLPDANSPRQMLVDKAASHDPTCGYEMYLYYYEGVVYLKADIGTTDGTPIKVSSPVNLALHQWTHTAFTWNAQTDTLSLYRDGVLIDSTTAAGKVYRPSDGIASGSTAYLLRAGSRLTSSYGTFNGVLDDLKVSTAALKYVSPPPSGPYYGWINDYNGTETATIALWNFNAGYASGLGTVPVKDVITGDSQKLFLFGQMAVDADGKFGWALSSPGGQNGSDYTQVTGGGAGVFPAGSDPSLSVECWLNIKDNVSQDIQYIFDKQFSSSNGFKMYLSRDQIADPGITAPDYRLHFVVGNGTTTVDVSKVFGWEEGKWYHMAGTWDANSDTAKLYRNGVLVASVNSLGMKIANSSQNLRIGQRLGANYWTFDGLIDNARISGFAYDYAFDCDLWPQLSGDISGPNDISDCYVDFYDIAMLCEQWLNHVQTGTFFEPAPDLAAGYDSAKLYPDGKIFPFGFYSVKEPDIYNLKNNGFTTMGPYYVDPNAYRDEANSIGLKYYYHVGMNLDPDNFVLPSDSEIQTAVTAQINAVKNDSTIGVWAIQPEELKYNQPNQVHYLQVAADAIRAADSAAGRPVWMYESNNRTASNLAVTVAYQDICGKGMYTNFVGNQNNRIYCKWTIEQEVNAIASANPSAVPIAVPEMFQDPNAQIAHLIPDWTRHDTYLALITGAKGVEIFSGFRRPELANYYDEYYEGYASVARELNGELNLGQVFLFGQRKTDISVSINSGPNTVSMTTPAAYTAPSVNYANIAYKDGSRYLFVVNSANSAVGINISGLPTGTIYRQDLLESGTYIAMTGGSFSAVLEPLAVKCYRFVKSSADISGPADLPDGSVNLFDFAKIAENWMKCENPVDAQCQ